MGGNFLNTNISDAVKRFEISAFSLKTFGFLLPTALASAALSYLIQPSIFKSSATGLILSLSLFTIFKFGLGLSLFPFPKFLLG